MRLVIAAPFILALLPMVAGAQVFRCPKEGTTVFSDKPCEEGAKAYAPKPILVVPAGKAVNLADQYDDRQFQKKQERDEANAVWNKEHQERTEQEEAIRDARIERKAIAGMSQDQVRDMFGEAQVVSHNENMGVVREGWTYKHNDGSRTIVYFKDGIVTGTASKSKAAAR